MAEHPNARIMRRAAEAVSAGDLATLAVLIHEDGEWHVPGRSLLAGQHRGRDSIFTMFDRVMRESEGTFRTALQEVLAGGDAVVHVDRITARRAGRRLDMRRVVLAHIRDGRIIEAWDHFEDPYGWDAFWA